MLNGHPISAKLPDDLGIGGIDPVPPLASIWFNGERLIPDAPLP